MRGLGVFERAQQYQRVPTGCLCHSVISFLTLFIILLIRKNFLLNIVTSIRFLSMIATLALHISHIYSSFALHFFRIKIFNGRQSL